MQVAQAAPSGHLKNKASVALPLTAEELAKKAAEEEYDNSPEGHRVRLEELALDRLERLSKKKKREKKKLREAKIKMQKKRDMGINQTGTSALQETGDHLFSMPRQKSMQSIIRNGNDLTNALIPQEGTCSKIESN